MDCLTKVDFVGLGNIGRPMAALLLKAGFALTVLGANEKAQQAFVAKCEKEVTEILKRQEAFISDVDGSANIYLA